MELKQKTKETITILTNINVSLANGIRRSVSEIPILAIDEADIYKNDSALYDEIIAHRLGLIPIKNQKLKAGETLDLKLKAKGKGERTEVLSGELGDSVVYPDMPIVLLEDGQEIELVAKAKTGTGEKHAKFSPGVIFYKHLPKIKLTQDGEKQTELAEIYPETFEMYGNKLKVKDASTCDLDEEDFVNYPGVEVSFDNNLVLTIESWGQIDAKEIFLNACKALKDNLSEVSKVLK